MKKKELKEICGKLFELFDNQDESLGFPVGPFPLSSFIRKITEGDYLYNAVNESAKFDKEKATSIITSMEEIGFAFGFAIGQMLDVTYPGAQEIVDKIKKVIQEKNLLPLLPRGRKAGKEAA